MLSMADCILQCDLLGQHSQEVLAQEPLRETSSAGKGHALSTSSSSRCEACATTLYQLIDPKTVHACLRDASTHPTLVLDRRCWPCCIVLAVDPGTEDMQLLL